MAVTPTPVVTPALLETLRNHPDIPKNVWYLVAATTLSLLNLPDEIPRVYQDAISRGSGPTLAAPETDEKLSISRRMREALVKSAAVGGVPKVSFPD